MHSVKLYGAAFLVVCAAAVITEAAHHEYERPSAEEALTFLRSTPPVARRVDGEPKLVQLWADKTANDIRTMKELKPGGHIEGGAHFHLEADNWRYFTAFEQLEIAELWEVDGANDIAFKHLGHMSQTLRSLSIEGVEISSAGLRTLKNLQNLEILRIGWSKGVSDEALAPVAEMSSLKELLISGNKEVTGSGFKHLEGHPNLRNLKASGTSITDDAFAHIGRIPNLEFLDLARSEGLTGSGLENLSRLPLTTLLLQRSPIQGDGLLKLASLTTLETLNLGQCEALDAKVIRGLAALSKLKHLDLSGTSVDDDILAEFANFPALEHLSVNACGSVTGTGASALSARSGLKILNLSNCALTDDTLEALGDLSVEELIIGNNAITVNGIRSLLNSSDRLKQLKKIHIWHIGVSDRRAPTDEEVAPLKALRPNVEFAY